MKLARLVTLGLTLGAAVVPLSVLAVEVAPQTQPALDGNTLIQAIRDARDPSATVDAYAKARAGGADTLAAERVYLVRMTDFGLPEMADSQAQDLILRDPNNGLAWGVAAHMSARRGNMAAALGQIETAVNQSPNDPFVLRTAGSIFAWYDSRGAGADIPDVIKVPIPDIKKRLQSRQAYTMAYDNGLKEYAQAPATPPTQPVQTADTTAYTAPVNYPVSTTSYAYEVPTYYPVYTPSYGYYSSCPTPYWYPSYSSWCGSPWFGWGFGASVVIVNSNKNNCNWNGNNNWNGNGKNWNGQNWNGNNRNQNGGSQSSQRVDGGFNRSGSNRGGSQQVNAMPDPRGHAVMSAPAVRSSPAFVGPVPPSAGSGSVRAAPTNRGGASISAAPTAIRSAPASGGARSAGPARGGGGGGRSSGGGGRR